MLDPVQAIIEAVASDVLKVGCTAAANDHDWITPGEFRYCGCGFRLLHSGTPTCAYCLACSQVMGEEQLRQADATHADLERERKELATVRRAQGLPALFWLGDNNA